jgi:RNA polymerase sigma-70 factor (ECF subfamily)
MSSDTDDGNRERLLTERISHGDRVAMREFYDRYRGCLTAVCRRYVTLDDDVKDVLQESFIRIFASMGRFEYRGEGALRAWASRIVVNESLKYLKARKRSGVWAEVTENLAQMAEEVQPDFESVPTPVIIDMIRSLPEGYRTVFNLYVLENMSHRQIARELNIAESTSASQLHRAKRILAEKIKKYGNE